MHVATLLRLLVTTLVLYLPRVKQVNITISEGAGSTFTTSLLGATLQPISWQEMRCPKTGKIERRKCAKPLDL